MKLELTEQHYAFQEEAHAFVDEAILPMANQIDADGATPRQLIDAAASRGYLGAALPPHYGGMGWDYVTVGLLNEEIGRGCSSIRSLLTVHGMAALAIARWGTEQQKKQWLPVLAQGEKLAAFGLTEPRFGSDASRIEATAVLEGSHFVLNGTKKWITYGQIADVILIFAQYEGRPTAFLVEGDSPGFRREPLPYMLGTRGSMLAELHLENCRIPKENMLGIQGAGITYVASNCLDYGRFTIAWGCVGIAQACLDESLSYATARKQFDRPIGDNQLIQKMITEMTVNVKAARLLCLQAAALKDSGDPAFIMETWNAKYYASTMLGKITSDAVQIQGAHGCSPQSNVQRCFRDAKVMEIIEGTTQLHEIYIATHAYRGLGS